MTLRLILFIQGVYYALSGLWALYDIESFTAVTGPKTDIWLVKTVAVLVLAIAGVLVFSCRRPRPPAEAVLLALLSAAAFAAVEFFYSLRGTISWVYFADAVFQTAFICLILVTGFKQINEAVRPQAPGISSSQKR